MVKSPANIYCMMMMEKHSIMKRGLFTGETITVEKDNKGNWKGTISAAENGKPNTIGNVHGNL